MKFYQFKATIGYGIDTEYVAFRIKRAFKIVFVMLKHKCFGNWVKKLLQSVYTGHMCSSVPKFRFLGGRKYFPEHLHSLSISIGPRVLFVRLQNLLCTVTIVIYICVQAEIHISIQYDRHGIYTFSWIPPPPPNNPEIGGRDCHHL